MLFPFPRCSQFRLNSVRKIRISSDALPVLCMCELFNTPYSLAIWCTLFRQVPFLRAWGTFMSSRYSVCPTTNLAVSQWFQLGDILLPFFRGFFVSRAKRVARCLNLGCRATDLLLLKIHMIWPTERASNSSTLLARSRKIKIGIKLRFSVWRTIRSALPYVSIPVLSFQIFVSHSSVYFLCMPSSIDHWFQGCYQE